MSKFNFENLEYKKPSLITRVSLFTGIHNSEITIDPTPTSEALPGDNSTGTGGNGSGRPKDGGN